MTLPDHENSERADGAPTPPNWVEKWTLGVLACAFFAALWAGFEAHRLVKATDRAIVAADEAAEKQREITRESARQQLRAYMMFEHGVMKDAKTPEISAINAGQTPAFNVAAACRMAVREKILHSPIFEWPQTKYDTIDVAPGKSFTLPSCTGDPNNSDPVRNTLYLWGLIDYTDVFYKCQFLAFITRIEDDPKRLTLRWASTNHPDEPCKNANSIYRKADWPGPAWLPDFDPESPRKPPGIN